MQTLISIYQPRDSLLHRVHPLSKVTGVVLLVGAAVLASDYRGLAVLGVAVAIAAVAAKSFLRDVLNDLWNLRWMFLLTIVIHLALVAPPEDQNMPFWQVMARKAGKGCFFAAKIAVMASLAATALRTVHPSELIYWLEGVFRRGFGRRLALVLGLAWRFLPVMLTEARRIRLAQTARGWKPSKGLTRRVSDLKLLVVPLVEGSLDRAEVVSRAMAARGYKWGTRRSLLYSRPWTRADVAVLAVASGLAACSLVCRWW